MLAIRMQRTGRKGHAMFRMIVQESRLSPTSGKVVARLGSYDPHAKNLSVDKEKASFYLEHGARPSDRVAVLLKGEGVKLPGWAVPSPKKQSKTRFPEKRRSTAPAEVKTEEPAVQDTADVAEPAAEQPADVATETVPAEAAPAEAETPARTEAEATEEPAEQAETTEAEPDKEEANTEEATDGKE